MKVMTGRSRKMGAGSGKKFFPHVNDIAIMRLTALLRVISGPHLLSAEAPRRGRICMRQDDPASIGGSSAGLMLG
jgi:hypothetical protein